MILIAFRVICLPGEGTVASRLAAAFGLPLFFPLANRYDPVGVKIWKCGHPGYTLFRIRYPIPPLSEFFG
jgi:hypothetical protein